MKKFILITSIVLLIALSVIHAFAAVPASVKSVNATRGETITVKLNLSESATIGSAGVAVSFDSKVLELVKGEWNVKDAMLVNFDTNTNNGAVAYMNTGKVSGTVFTATFKVKSDAAFGDTTVKMELTLKDGSSSKMSVTNKDGKVTVECSHKFSSWSSKGNDKHER